LRTYILSIQCIRVCSSLGLYIIFFFYSPDEHRHPHSFPTRRSSDLSRWHRLPHKTTHCRRRHDTESPRYVDVAREIICNSGRNRDRKSTRLNSSHVSISYAVFCLKKKNNRIQKITNKINNLRK